MIDFVAKFSTKTRWETYHGGFTNGISFRCQITKINIFVVFIPK